MGKKKILWIGDGGVASGFARVNHSIISRLPEEYEVHHLAVNYKGDPYPDADHYMYPAERTPGDYLGFYRVQELYQKIQPDLVFVLNDPWVIVDYMRFIPATSKTVVYTPVDAHPLDANWVNVLNVLNQVVTYTEFGKRAFTSVKPDFKEIEVVPHGIDRDKFFPIDRLEARRQMGDQMPMDGFIVLNANRNQPRKRIDLTMKAFSEFAQDKDNVYLYLHMGVKDMGWNIKKLAARYGFKPRQLILTSENTGPSQYVSDEYLNLIYNATDVGINTSLGEGWGLVSVEHGLCGVPQIVPNSSAPAEIFPDNTVQKIDISHYEPYTETLTESAVVSVANTVECLNKYYYDKEFAREHAVNLRNYLLQPQFDWDNVTKRFVDIFERVLNDDNVPDGHQRSN